MHATTDGAAPPPTRRLGRFAWERALRSSGLPARRRLVAYALATFADADGDNVRPGIPVLATAAGLPASTTRAHLKALREAGWARRVAFGSTGGTSNSADTHQLTVPVSVGVAAEPAPVLMDQPSPAAAPATPAPAARVRGAAAQCSPAPAPPPAAPPPPPAAEHCPPATSAGQPAPQPQTTAHQPALVPPDHRSPVSTPPLTSQRLPIKTRS